MGAMKKLEQREKKGAKRQGRTVLLWTASVFCLFAAWIYRFGISSLLFLLCGVFCMPIPPMKKLWARIGKSGKKWIVPTIGAVLFVIAALLSSQSPEILPDSGNHAVSQTEEKSTFGSADLNFKTGEENGTSVPAEGTSAEENCVFSDWTSIPAYSGAPFVAVNGNIPFFGDVNSYPASFEKYSELDRLDRCGTAFSAVGKETMPTEPRTSIGQVRPSGWQTVKYDHIDGKYLYNRCHLIGFQLTGENANEKNLITGTRYLNVEGMLPFENMVADFVKETGNHVLYRVTPYFEGTNLVASGVLIEAKSVEDNGEGILFCVYCYNVQPQVKIDYATGNSSFAPVSTAAPTTTTAPKTTTTSAPPATDPPSAPVQDVAYVLNTNTKKFHRPSCSDIKKMSDKNRRNVNWSRDEVVQNGYEACKNCKP